MADILGSGAFGDPENPDLKRSEYVHEHPDEVPPFDDRDALELDAAEDQPAQDATPVANPASTPEAPAADSTQA